MRAAKTKTAVAAKTFAAHTPAPWINAGRLGHAYLVKSSTKTIAAVYGHEEAVANTALIVAAPDLLSLCRAALEHIQRETAVVIECNSDLGEDGEPVPGTLDPLAVDDVAAAQLLLSKLTGAIAKAEGRI